MDFCFYPLGNIGRRGDALKIIGNIEIGLIERQRLNDRRVLCENRANLRRNLFIDIEPRLDQNKFRASPVRRYRRHGRAGTEFARFIARGRHHAPLERAADGNRLATQLRIVALFDGREDASMSIWITLRMSDASCIARASITWNALLPIKTRDPARRGVSRLLYLAAPLSINGRSPVQCGASSQR